MVTQLRELMEALQAREHRLMGDYASSAQLIPQVVWALILATQDFYHQVCMHSQLDPSTGTPLYTKALLSTYTHMIALKMRLDLNGLPHQWHLQPTRHHNNKPPPTPANTAKPSAQKNGKAMAGNTHVAQSSAPTTTLRTNAQWPHIFASNNTLKMLREKQGHTLSNIFSEAGISGRGEHLDLTGLPDNLCLCWLILGKCGGGRKGEACN